MLTNGPDRATWSHSVEVANRSDFAGIPMAPLETHRVKRAMEINTAGGLGVHGQAPAHRSVLQRHFNFYRLASYTLGLFALGHTFGALVNTPRLGSASDQVVARMQSVGVLAQGARTTWYDFYLAFGYLDTIFFLFSMVVAWFLGGRLPQERRALWPIAWALLASQVGGLVITSCFLFPAPIVFSGVLVLLLGAGCVADSLART